MNMRIRQLKFIATNGAARMIVSLSNPKAISFVKKFENIETTIEKRVKNSINLKKILLENIPFCLELVNDGKKLCVKAPSAKILLKRFGSLKATIKISVYIFAPKIEACNISLIKPKTLEKSVPKLLVKIDLNMVYTTKKSIKLKYI